MKRFGMASRGTRNGSTSTQAGATSSPFDSDRSRSVAATHELDHASGLSRISTACSPRAATFSRCSASPGQRQGSFMARLNSLRTRYGRSGDRPASPSISQPTDVRLVQRGSPVNYITTGSPPQPATTSPNHHVPDRSSSLGFFRFDNMPPSPLASHPVTAEDFHSVASRTAEEKHFRCIIHIDNADDYREAELILKGMVAEAGGKVLDATHRWPGGFFYSMEGDTLSENPLEDGAKSPRGGRISIVPFNLSEPISFNGIRTGMLRANLVEIPPRVESRLQGKQYPPPPATCDSGEGSKINLSIGEAARRASIATTHHL